MKNFEMGKKGKGKQGDLGKALLRDRFGANRSKRGAKEGSLVRLCHPCVEKHSAIQIAIQN